MIVLVFICFHGILGGKIENNCDSEREIRENESLQKKTALIITEGNERMRERVYFFGGWKSNNI
jgi:hypothetical protein